MFGVKESLIVDLSKVTDADMAKRCNVQEGTLLLTYDFVLVSVKETLRLRSYKTKEAIEKMDGRVEDFQGLPVLDVD